MLLVALGWWWRRSRWLPGYGIAVAAAAFTHFYGLFVFAAAVVWGSWRRRWGLMATAVLALLPALAWIAYASAYLLSSRLGQLDRNSRFRPIGRHPGAGLGALAPSQTGSAGAGGFRRAPLGLGPIGL